MKKFLKYTLAILAFATMVSCEDEKPLIIYDQALPLKTDVLYMLGDATPNGWDNGNPTAFIQDENDKRLFTWEGTLYEGEIKLCTTPGSWDVPFIRPAEDQRAIGKENIVDEKFVMWAGDPDNKWRVTEGGKYLLTFNVRNWTMSTQYLGGSDGPTITPIETEVFYIIGDAAPCGWDNGSPTPTTKKSQYIFEYDGNLKAGELKAMCETGTWDCAFFRPTAANVAISKSGVADEDCAFSKAPDNKWLVKDAGHYRLTFDLQNWKMKAEYLGELLPEGPVKPCIYLIGDAAPCGWNIDNPTKMEEGEVEGVYEWTGRLKLDGECAFKACREKGSWENAFIHPVNTTEAVLSSSNNIVNQVIDEYPGDPDNKWIVQTAGTYHLTFDLNNYTFSAEFIE